jgi:hypothetical protein
MRRLAVFVILAALIAAFSSPVLAARPDIPTVSGYPGIFFTDKLLKYIYPVATDTPLPTQLMGSSSVRIIDSGASSGMTGNYVSTPVQDSLTVSANGKDFAIVNLGTETLWLGFSGGATVSQGIPVYPETIISRDAKPGFKIWHVASSTVPFAYDEGQQ